MTETKCGPVVVDGKVEYDVFGEMYVIGRYIIEDIFEKYKGKTIRITVEEMDQ